MNTVLTVLTVLTTLIRTKDNRVLIPEIDFGRHCVRCGAEAHPTDAPHLCPDVEAGWNAFLAEERERAFREHAAMLLVLGGEG